MLFDNMNGALLRIHAFAILTTFHGYAHHPVQQTPVQQTSVQ